MPTIQSKAFNALTQWEIFTQSHHIESRFLAEIEYQFRRLEMIVRGPVGVSTTIDHVRRRESRVAITATIACSCLRTSGQIITEGAVQYTTKLPQRVDVRFRYLPQSIRRQIQ
jgi:hypothetical protein